MSLAGRVNRVLRRFAGVQVVRSRRPSVKTGSDRLSIRPREVFTAIGTLRARSAQSTDADGNGQSDRVIDLRLAELKVFSQNGEDGIIFELVRSLPGVEPYFVEFGVEDGLECNTRFLLEVLGWSGVYLQPPGEHLDSLMRRWAGRDHVVIIPEAVEAANVNELFRRAGVPRTFGVLSIDVDGQDYWIWQNLADDFEPAIVVIECNATWPPGVKRVETPGIPWSADFSDSLGASIDALGALGREKGYTLVHVDLAGVNAFFVRDDLLGGRTVLGVTHRPPNHDLAGARHPAEPVRPTITT